MNAVAARAVSLINSTDPIIRTKLSYAEAVAHIKRSKGKTIFLYASHATRHPEKSWRDISAYVIVSKPALLRFLGNAYREDVRATHGIELGECSDCLFVG